MLNRVLTRGYTDGATPTTTYLYDNLPNAKGRLIEVDNGVSKTKYTWFDGVGRILASEQTTAGDAATRIFGYQYNLSGALIAETYPSGRVVRNELDADGELSRVTSQKNTNTGQRLMASSFVTTAAGAVSSVRLGNGRWENTSFNARLQPVQMGLGNNAADTSAWKVEFDYGTTANNGNIVSQKITVPTVEANTGFTAIQNYSYDSLNRLSSAVETIGGAETWKQSYTFDRFGNRRLNFTNNATTFPAANQGLPKVINPEADLNTNRLKSDQDGNNVADYIFDAAGNLTRDAENRSFIYDGENKQIAVKDASNNAVGTYFYDGDGKRVKKINNQTGEVTIFVYDAAGKLSAEYSNNVAANTAPQTSYLTNDHLGSPRVITDAQGKVTSRRDFLPFGEDAATPQRTIALGYQSDNTRQRFTSYEKDAESGLDFAQARMYSNQHARFTSPDSFLNDTKISRPQSWNLYVYVRNNPLRLVDPSGEKAEVKIKRDKKAKTVTINITATFAVYGAKGQNVTPEQLEKQRKLIEDQIKSTYTVSKKGKDGYNYIVSANITATVASSEEEAKKSGADNLVEVGNDKLMSVRKDGTSTDVVGVAYSFKGETFDRMSISLIDENEAVDKGNTYAHEFSHLLGVTEHSTNDDDVLGTAAITPSAITKNDINAFFGSQVKQLNKTNGTTYTARVNAVVSPEQIKWVKK